MNKNKKISFVILSWNKLADTKVCLKSIRNIDYENYEIIVVDNGSTDGSKDWLSKQKDIIYVDLPENTGFTGGQLAAYKVSKGEYLALINNDAVISPDWIKESLKSFDKDNKVAVVGGRAYKWEGNQKSFSESNEFYSYQVIDLYTGSAETLMTGDEEVEVNSISGAGVMISRKAIEKVGYFDDRFFAYYEETDLFARMKRAGFKIVYNPRVKTWHKIGQSTKSNPYFYLYQMNRNRFIFAYKNYDKKYLNYFKKIYFKQAVKSLKNIILNRHDIEDKARVDAFWWNVKNYIGTRKSKKSVVKLGKKYNEKLLDDDCRNVSVIIPCYNYEKYVSKSIKSAINQTQKPMEIIVVNDGSTDKSKDKIQKFKSEIIFVDKKNEGTIVAKNNGLALARGKWLIFLDADDYLDQEYIKETIKLARLDNADVVYTDMKLFGAKSKIFKSIKFNKKNIQKENFIHNSALINKSLADSIGGYKKNMQGGYEDWEFYISLYESGARMSYLNKALLYYRQHIGGARNDQAGKIAEKLVAEIVKIHPKTFGLYFKTKKIIYKFLRIIIKSMKILKILWPPFWIRFFNAKPRIDSKMKNEKVKNDIKFRKSILVEDLKKLKLLKAIKDLYRLWDYYYELGRPEKNNLI